MLFSHLLPFLFHDGSGIGLEEAKISITDKHCKLRPSLRSSCSSCKSCMLYISPWANTSLHGTE